jgi:glycosyltransferase involved in cell wall biosynthesis
MARSLVFLVPTEFKGENQGLYVQHVASMEWLLDSSADWRMEVSDLSSPRLAEDAARADLVVIHMLDHVKAEGVIRRRSAAGLPTVFEISDNFLDLGSWLPKRHRLRSPLVRQRILYHAWLCDAVQVYAASLSRLFASVNPRITVLDPYVPIAEPEPSRGNGPLVFGWAGTTSHENDVARIAPAVMDFCGRHPDAVFAFMGERALFDRHFAGLPPRQAQVRSFSPYDDYLAFVRSWDVGLAPLGREGFNNGRSDTKFATYAACGVVPLLEAHPVHAPHAGTALMFDGPAELTVHLERLYANRALAREIGGRAKAWARRERSADRLREQRIRFYESVARQPGRSSARAEPAIPDLDAAVGGSPLEQLRRSHRSWDRRIDFLREMLRHQPYDYIALRAVIAHCEAEPGGEAELQSLYERLSLVAAEAVPRDRRPAPLRDFLPA